MNSNKSFGIVTVAPNEYVVHTRLGKIKNEGLGQTFFLVPMIDSYIKFSITPHKINFYADNITKERQGVGIDGFLIWSIDDGNRAYKKIDSSDLESIDNLSLQLIDISVSIARHTISNMTLDEVLTNREILVEKLTHQLEKIIGDWGLKIEAIEIKEVRVLSETLFESLQAPYRNEQLKIAEHSRLEVKKSIENTSIETESAIRIRKSEQELMAKEIEIDNTDKQSLMEHNARLKEEERQLKQKLTSLEYQSQSEIKQKELTRQQAEKDKELITSIEESKRAVIKEQYETEKYSVKEEASKNLLSKESELNLKDRDLEYIQKEREAEVGYKRALNDINNDLSHEAMMKTLFIEMGHSLKNMNFEKAQWYSMGDTSPLGTLPKTIVEIATTLQGMGFINPDKPQQEAG
jgi:hypothetical protein